MNILVFTVAFHPAIGGLETQTRNLVNEFRQNGHNVKIVALQFQGMTKGYEAPQLKNPEVYYRPSIVKKIRLFMWCHIFYMPNISLQGILLLFINPFKRWVVSHNDFYLKNSSIKTKAKRVLIKFASHNIAVSKHVADSINTRATVIYNCYDDDMFKAYTKVERMYDFVFLGRLVSQKGCDLLINACCGLKESFSLNIIGDGPEKPKLEKMVQDFGMERRIKFLGVLEGKSLAIALNQHRIMVIPSIEAEGFGIVALEGLACGCKIIAANAGGLAEAVNSFGKTFTMKNQSELRHLLSAALKEPAKDEKNLISTDLNTYLGCHKKDAIAQQYLKLFE